MSSSALAKPEPALPLAPQEPDAVLSLIERAARDQSIDVDKMDRLLQMHERMTARRAEERFHEALSAAQTEMRHIATDAYNPSTKSRYASYPALDRALRPLYTKHGFGLSFNTADGAVADWVRVVCDVSHAGGHAKRYHVDMPADGKGAKGGDVMTKTHAVGAAMSYGMRYLLKMIFNVAVGEDDTDGNMPAEREAAPQGYDDWLKTLKAKATEGMKALTDMWNVASRDEDLKPYLRYLTNEDRGVWEELKKQAGQVKAAKR